VLAVGSDHPAGGAGTIGFVTERSPHPEGLPRRNRSSAGRRAHDDRQPYRDDGVGRRSASCLLASAWLLAIRASLLRATRRVRRTAVLGSADRRRQGSRRGPFSRSFAYAEPLSAAAGKPSFPNLVPGDPNVADAAAGGPAAPG
jgi:hypothetical protein